MLLPENQLLHFIIKIFFFLCSHLVHIFSPHYRSSVQIVFLAAIVTVESIHCPYSLI